MKLTKSAQNTVLRLQIELTKSVTYIRQGDVDVSINSKQKGASSSFSSLLQSFLLFSHNQQIDLSMAENVFR